MTFYPTDSSATSNISTGGAATVQDATPLVVAVAGSVAAGASSVAFKNSGSTVATVQGVTIPVGESWCFDADDGSTLDVINYDPNGGQLTIIEVRNQ